MKQILSLTLYTFNFFIKKLVRYKAKSEFGFEHLATVGRFVAKRMSEFLAFYLTNFSQEAKSKFGFEPWIQELSATPQFLALYLNKLFTQ
ncbi:MAG: hypothetical protein OXC37_02425 [Bdellovibrionaceae bacterium]|nr:hypothetical protein [Pseudobdellovibrionaceae bacterium]